MNLRERLRTRLKKAYNTGFWDDISREDAVADSLAKASAATIAADLKGIVEWQQYTGDYTKQYYDIKLWTGEVYEQCWPNANTFHEGVIGKVIEGKDVAYIRINPTAAVDRYCGVEGKG